MTDPLKMTASNLVLACIASVSVGLGSKERPRNGTGNVFCPREIGARAKIRKGVGEGKEGNLSLPLPSLLSRGNSLPLNPTETLATQANLVQRSAHTRGLVPATSPTDSSHEAF